jgi:hypothetical protein
MPSTGLSEYRGRVLNTKNEQTVSIIADPSVIIGDRECYMLPPNKESTCYGALSSISY